MYYQGFLLEVSDVSLAYRYHGKKGTVYLITAQNDAYSTIWNPSLSRMLKKIFGIKIARLHH
jgi:hypothetical protein